jgi:nucleoside phosphorylase
MPGMGKAASAIMAVSFRASFPFIRLGLIVEVCGGVPRDESENFDILLGDVIISTGIIQFDFGR